MTRPITAHDLECLLHRIEDLWIYLDAVEFTTGLAYCERNKNILDRLEYAIHVHDANELDGQERCLDHEVIVSLELAVEHAADLKRIAWAKTKQETVDESA